MHAPMHSHAPTHSHAHPFCIVFSYRAQSAVIYLYYSLSSTSCFSRGCLSPQWVVPQLSVSLLHPQCLGRCSSVCISLTLRRGLLWYQIISHGKPCLLSSSHMVFYLFEPFLENAELLLIFLWVRLYKEWARSHVSLASLGSLLCTLRVLSHESLFLPFLPCPSARMEPRPVHTRQTLPLSYTPSICFLSSFEISFHVA